MKAFICRNKDEFEYVYRKVLHSTKNVTYDRVLELNRIRPNEALIVFEIAEFDIYSDFIKNSDPHFINMRLKYTDVREASTIMRKDKLNKIINCTY